VDTALRCRLGAVAETPDFDQLARAFMESATDHGSGSVFGHAVTLALAEQLRQVWNARGAADVAAVKAEVTTGDEFPLMRTLDRVVRGLDR
jgi:hypothetical protein